MIKSWKTTLAGVLSIAPQLLHTFYPTVVTAEVANSLTGLFVALGLIAAKDGNVTGGTTPQ
jgi:uncharacterized membrane protein